MICFIGFPGNQPKEIWPWDRDAWSLVGGRKKSMTKGHARSSRDG